MVSDFVTKVAESEFYDQRANALTTVPPQTDVETTEAALLESSGNNVVRNKND